LSPIETWSGASVGRRQNQEDWYAVVPRADGVLLVVADGMGGHAAGEVASRLAGEAVVGSLIADDCSEGALMQAARAANDALAQAIRKDSALDGMGTTLLAAVITQRQLRWLSVGDSLLMLYRDGQLTRLNADHSLGAWVDEQVRTGAMDETEAEAEGPRNGLLSVVSGDVVEMIELVAAPVALEPGDILLVATDGIHTIDIEMTGELLAAESPLAERGMALLETIARADRPHQDNTSIILARIEEPRLA